MTTSTDFPFDPRLIAAVESAFLRASLTPLQFADLPEAWRSATKETQHRKGPKKKAGLRYRLAYRDGGAKCAYCGEDADHLDEMTVDHVIPHEIVKHWEIWNLVLSCHACNNYKNNRVPALVMPMLCALLYQLATLRAAKRQMREQAQIQRRIAAITRIPTRLAIEAPKRPVQMQLDLDFESAVNASTSKEAEDNE